jgi:Protein of unknown function (DUF2934)
MAAEEKSKKGGKVKKGAEKLKSIEVEPLKIVTEPVAEPSLPKKAPIAESAPLKKTLTKPSVAKAKAVAPVAAVEATKAPVEAIKAPAPKKSAPKKKAGVIVTLEQIQLRAYFIAERRKNLGLAGDEAADWVQAEKELRTEAAEK